MALMMILARNYRQLASLLLNKRLLKVHLNISLRKSCKNGYRLLMLFLTVLSNICRLLGKLKLIELNICMKGLKMTRVL